MAPAHFWGTMSLSKVNPWRCVLMREIGITHQLSFSPNSTMNQDRGQFSEITVCDLSLRLFFLSRTNPVAKMGIVYDSFQKEQLSATLTDR